MIQPAVLLKYLSTPIMKVSLFFTTFTTVKKNKTKQKIPSKGSKHHRPSRRHGARSREEDEREVPTGSSSCQ